MRMDGLRQLIFKWPIDPLLLLRGEVMGRGDRIWICDILYPKQMHCQVVLHTFQLACNVIIENPRLVFHIPLSITLYRSFQHMVFIHHFLFLFHFISFSWQNNQVVRWLKTMKWVDALKPMTVLQNKPKTLLHSCIIRFIFGFVRSLI